MRVRHRPLPVEQFLARNRRSVGLASAALALAIGWDPVHRSSVAGARCCRRRGRRAEHVQAFMLTLLEGARTPRVPLRICASSPCWTAAPRKRRAGRRAADASGAPSRSGACIRSSASTPGRRAAPERPRATSRAARSDRSRVGEDLVALGLLRLEQARMDEPSASRARARHLAPKAARDHPALARRSWASARCSSTATGTTKPRASCKRRSSCALVLRLRAGPGRRDGPARGRSLPRRPMGGVVPLNEQVIDSTGRSSASSIRSSPSATPSLGSR